jgi:hypothetical protein
MGSQVLRRAKQQQFPIKIEAAVIDQLFQHPHVGLMGCPGNAKVAQ